MTVLFVCSCGGQIQTISTETDIIGSWTGTYFGTIVYALGHVPERREGLGLPARLIIEPDGSDMRVEIVTAGDGPRWLFFLMPEVFSENDAEFSRTGVPGQDSRRYTVYLRQDGTQITGRLKIVALLDNSTEPVGEYYLEFTRQNTRH